MKTNHLFISMIMLSKSAVACIDNSTYSFGSYVYWKRSKLTIRTCNWIVFNPNKVVARRNKWCGESVNGTVVKTHCPVACLACNRAPTGNPSNTTDVKPSIVPTEIPSSKPSSRLFLEPSSFSGAKPISFPSTEPSISPTSQQAIKSPSLYPTNFPSLRTTVPSGSDPTLNPSALPSMITSVEPTILSTMLQSINPSLLPSWPSVIPSTDHPTIPSLYPTSSLSTLPSIEPSRLRTTFSTSIPSNEVRELPYSKPSLRPRSRLSSSPRTIPTTIPISTAPTVVLSDKLCDPSDILGQTFYTAYNNWCIRVQIYGGGAVAMDVTDPACTNDEFVVTRTFATFNGIEKHKVHYLGDESMSFVFSDNEPTISGLPEMKVISMLVSPMEFELKISSCIVSTATPSYPSMNEG